MEETLHGTIPRWRRFPFLCKKNIQTGVGTVSKTSPNNSITVGKFSSEHMSVLNFRIDSRFVIHTHQANSLMLKFRLIKRVVYNLLNIINYYIYYMYNIKIYTLYENNFQTPLQNCTLQSVIIRSQIVISDFLEKIFSVIFLFDYLCSKNYIIKLLFD